MHYTEWVKVCIPTNILGLANVPVKYEVNAYQVPYTYINKKVLLRERKRHTARHVASTPYVVLTGYPPTRVPPQAGYPRAGYPPSQGTPRPGYPPARVPPRLDLAGYPPPAAPWHSGKCCKALWDTGTPPPPPDVNRLKTLPSPILRMRAVMIIFIRTRDALLINVFWDVCNFQPKKGTISWSKHYSYITTV